MLTHYCLFTTGLGPVGVAWSQAGIARLQLPERTRAATEERLLGRSGELVPSDPPRSVQLVIADVQRYLDGNRVDFAGVVLDFAGVGTFHREIYQAARRVGWGATTTYGELARLAGFPAAARAVGQAMGRNPVPIIIPCHRVLASGGKPGGFSAFGGTSTKDRMLALEGVSLDGAGPRLPGL